MKALTCMATPRLSCKGAADRLRRRASEESILAIQIFDQKKFKKKDQGFLGVINVRIGSVIDMEIGGDGASLTPGECSASKPLTIYVRNAHARPQEIKRQPGCAWEAHHKPFDESRGAYCTTRTTRNHTTIYKLSLERRTCAIPVDASGPYNGYLGIREPTAT